YLFVSYHKDRFENGKWKMENGKFVALSALFPLQSVTQKFKNAAQNLHNPLCFIILRTHKSLTTKTIVL
ncbi:MAG: hypothetical protein IIV29_05130, partial [Tidjanibacter sp.]|nr:hypothetical protein [Tidjanibacter sp.]